MFYLYNIANKDREITVAGFVWKEEQIYVSLAVGMRFEVVSIGIFYAFYIITRNEANSYNRNALQKKY
jgi:hypothetical protein